MYLYNNKVVFFCMLVQVVMSIVVIVIQKMGYYRLLKISENMEYSKDIKLKNIGKNRKNVYNVDNYVDKCVNSFKFCGLKLYTISEICGYLLNFLFITWSILCIYGVYLEVDIKEILWIVMLGILIVGGLFNIGMSVDNYKLERMAKVNMKDYVENQFYMSKRKEEILKERKDKIKNEKINSTEKTVIDFAHNNENVVEMDKNIAISREDKEILKERIMSTQKEEKNMSKGINNDNSNKNQVKLGLNSDNLGYLSEYMTENKNDLMDKNKNEDIGVKINLEEERIIEGFLRQYFA